MDYLESGIKSSSYQDSMCIIVDIYLFLAVSTVLDLPVESNTSNPFGSAKRVNRPQKFDVKMPKRLSKKYF